METKDTLLIPVKQAFITLMGYQFLVVQLPDERIAIIIGYLCKALNVDRRSQIRRIQEHPLLAEHLLTVQVKTPKGERVVNALVVWALSGWLSGFQLARLAEEQRALILALQREAFDTFVRPFFIPEPKAPPKQPTATPQQSAPPKLAPAPAPLPAPTQAEPLPSVYDLHRALVDRMEEEHHALVQRLAGLEQEQQRLEDNLATRDRQHQEDVAWLAEAHHEMQLQREQIEVLWSVLLGRASAPEEALSAEQQHTLELLLHYHQRATGRPRDATEREVLGLVGVAERRHLRQGDWKPVLAWFRQRLGR